MNYIDEDTLMIINTSPIVGTVVKTSNNKSVGEVTGLLLNTFTGEVPFVLISLKNADKTTKNKNIVISWKDFEGNISQSRALYLDLKKISGRNLPHFNSGYQSAYSQYELMNTHQTQGWPGPYSTYLSQ